MIHPAEAIPFRFLFDQHVNGRALKQLQERGVDVVHAAEVGLASAHDPDLFAWAMQEGRLLVTRNYRDFAPLVHAHTVRGQRFPGVLFYPTSIRASDVGGHVMALERWIDKAAAIGRNPAENGCDWLR